MRGAALTGTAGWERLGLTSVGTERRDTEWSDRGKHGARTSAKVFAPFSLLNKS